MKCKILQMLHSAPSASFWYFLISAFPIFSPWISDWDTWFPASLLLALHHFMPVTKCGTAIRSFDPFVGKVICKHARGTQEAWPWSSVLTCTAKHQPCLPWPMAYLWQGMQATSQPYAGAIVSISVSIKRFTSASWIILWWSWWSVLLVLRLPDPRPLINHSFFWCYKISKDQLHVSSPWSESLHKNVIFCAQRLSAHPRHYLPML